MINVDDVINNQVRVPYPRWLKGMDRKCCFATKIGWVLLRPDGSKESVMMIKNLEDKVLEYFKTNQIILNKTSLDKEIESKFSQPDIIIQKEPEVKPVKIELIIAKDENPDNCPENDETPVKTENKEDLTQIIKDVPEKLDFIELEDGIETKHLRKGNLIRIYLTWTCDVNIRANDGKKTYIEVYDSKDNKLSNAYYKSRETEKTLMFVYKIGQEKLNKIKVNGKIFDGLVRNKKNENIPNDDDFYTFNVKVNEK